MTPGVELHTAHGSDSRADRAGTALSVRAGAGVLRRQTERLRIGTQGGGSSRTTA